MITDEELQVIYLKAGEMHYADRPSLVITVLGSCLSVTMCDHRTGIGGICHGLLPTCEDRKACATGCREGFRYVDCSIKQMLRLFEKAGSRKRDIEVKCFGGADMFVRKSNSKGIVSVGRQNILTAEETLADAGFKIVKQDVGGLGGRKLFFYTHTGEILLKRLAKAGSSPAAQAGAPIFAAAHAQGGRP